MGGYNSDTMGTSGGAHWKKPISNSENLFNQSMSQMATLLAKAPTQVPDLADPDVRAAHAAAMLNAQLGQTRKSTFLGSGIGLAPSSSAQKTLLGGG